MFHLFSHISHLLGHCIWTLVHESTWVGVLCHYMGQDQTPELLLMDKIRLRSWDLFKVIHGIFIWFICHFCKYVAKTCQISSFVANLEKPKVHDSSMFSGFSSDWFAVPRQGPWKGVVGCLEDFPHLTSLDSTYTAVTNIYKYMIFVDTHVRMNMTNTIWSLLESIHV